MAGTTTRAARAGSDTIAFELERFELTDEQRVEVVGRWFGVRGRRFVRPTLIGVAGGAAWRALAELEHKPWAAEEGEPWTATFRLDDGEDLDGAELAVAPDIAVDLPALRRAGRGRSGGRAQPTLIPRSSPPERDGAAQHNGAAESESARGGRPQRRPKRGDSEVDGAHAAASALREERDSAVVERDAVIAERDAARRMRDVLVRERDALLRERDGWLGERDALVHEREALLRERDGLDRDLEDLGRTRDDALRERGARAAECESLRAERDAANSDLASLAEDRDSLRRERDALAEELAALRDRPQTLPEPAGAPVPPPPARRRTAFPARATGDAAKPRPGLWGSRPLVLAALAMLVLALILVIRLSL
jgi:FtsZ-binding cell division protein ZapB